MQVRITRPVVISSGDGLRHLAPGLCITLTEEEAAQVLRQKAGSVTATDLTAESVPVQTPPKTPKGKTKTV